MQQHVLIVDDDQTIRMVLMQILNRAGYRTTEAINGLEALQKLRTCSFDLITMDMAMAEMDGVDTISILRNEITVPIVVISAHLSKQVKRELDACGITHFLAKPFSAQQVTGMVEKALQDASH